MDHLIGKLHTDDKTETHLEISLCIQFFGKSHDSLSTTNYNKNVENIHIQSEITLHALRN